MDRTIISLIQRAMVMKVIMSCSYRKMLFHPCIESLITNQAQRSKVKERTDVFRPHYIGLFFSWKMAVDWMQMAPFRVCWCPACSYGDLWHVLIWLWKNGGVLIWYWATQAWLNIFVAGFTDQWTIWLCHIACLNIITGKNKKTIAVSLIIPYHGKDMMWNALDVDICSEAVSLSWKVHITQCPNISVDKQKVDVV